MIKNITNNMQAKAEKKLTFCNFFMYGCFMQAKAEKKFTFCNFFMYGCFKKLFLNKSSVYFSFLIDCWAIIICVSRNRACGLWNRIRIRSVNSVWIWQNGEDSTRGSRTVPDFTISVYSCSCNYLFFGPHFLAP